MNFPESQRARQGILLETSSPFSLLIENVTVMLNFAQEPRVTNVSKTFP